MRKHVCFVKNKESLHVVNNSAIAQLHGIKLIYRIFESKFGVSGIVN